VSPSIVPVSANKLLCALAPDDLSALRPHLVAVPLPLREELETPNQAIKYVFFPESGQASIVGRGARRKELEVGIVGLEGMTGLVVVLGNDRSPNATFIQVAGAGQRIASEDLRDAMRERPTVRDSLLCYVQAMMAQISATAVANASANIEERLARWLLMSHDRSENDEVPLVHDFLAMMLGVHRPGVTVAIHSLEARRLIRGERGRIIIVDRGGLQQLAGASYGVPEAEYQRLIHAGK
jgi:CRP-like cAMP-binding protein